MASSARCPPSGRLWAQGESLDRSGRLASSLQVLFPTGAASTAIFLFIFRPEHPGRFLMRSSNAHVACRLPLITRRQRRAGMAASSVL